MQCLGINGFKDGFEELKIRAIEKDLTPATTLNADCLKIAYKEDPKTTLNLVSAIINRFAGQMNTYKPMTSAQVITLACDLIELFGNESLEDIILLFKNARQGKYGFRSRFDSSVVMEWIPQYLEQKALAREESKKREEAKRELAMKTIPMNEETKKLVKAFVQRRQADKALGRKKEKTPPPVDSTAYLIGLDAKPHQMTNEQWERIKTKHSESERT